MGSIKRALGHTGQVFLTLGLAVVLIAALGVLLVAWEGNPLVRPVVAFIAVLPILLALARVPLTAARFLEGLYDIRSAMDAYTFLVRMLFGPWKKFEPFLKVENGKITLGAGSVLHVAGGPGFMVIYNDSAVVTERFGMPYRVLGPGFPSLERFEKVWEIVDLRPQRWAYTVSAMTREGIPVSCVADVSFKIDDRVPDEHGHLQAKQPTTKEPYPYTEQAVFRAATSRWVRDRQWKKWPMDWAGRVVVGFTEGTLRDILAEYRLDWLIAPTGGNTEPPRETIRRRLEEQLRVKAERVGAKIISVDLGEIKVADEQVSHQWIEAWQADWESRALAARMEGEAELLRMDIAQAQAQAEMIIRLTQELQAGITSEDELRPYLLATRFVQALNLLSYDPYTRVRMPPEAIQTLQRLQQALGSAPSLPGR